MIDTRRHRAAVCGKPIAHSLSPVIHNAGYAAAGLTGWTYSSFECAESELPDLVAGLGREWAGLSCTMPLKEVALRIADEASPAAVAIGAANTLVRRPDGGWRADNTDVIGMVRTLRDAGLGAFQANSDGTRSDGPEWGGSALGGPDLDGSVLGGSALGGPDWGGPALDGTSSGVPDSDRTRPAGSASGVPTVTVLGGGGTARAALAAAAQLGAPEVTLVTRRPEAREELEPAAEALGVTLVGAPWSQAPDLFAADVVVSTVPKGAADHLAVEVTWRPGTVLFDAIYDPWPTPLAAAAAKSGIPVVSGLDLLLGQALSQFEQFTGFAPAPESAMREALFRSAGRAWHGSRRS